MYELKHELISLRMKLDEAEKQKNSVSSPAQKNGVQAQANGNGTQIK